MAGPSGTFIRGSILVLGLGSIVAVGAYAFRWTRNLDEFRFDPMRVELGQMCPDWLEPPMARALFASYERVAGEPVSTLSGDEVRAFQARVEALPWVRAVRVTRRLPRGATLDLELVRPEVVSSLGTGGVTSRVGLALIGRGGVRLPIDTSRGALSAVTADRFDLPFAGTMVVSGPLGMPVVLGSEPVSDSGVDPSVGAAAAIAEVLREKLLPHTRELLGEAGRRRLGATGPRDRCQQRPAPAGSEAARGRIPGRRRRSARPRRVSVVGA